MKLTFFAGAAISVAALFVVLHMLPVVAATDFTGPPAGCGSPEKQGCNVDGVIWLRSDLGSAPQNGNMVLNGDIRLTDGKAIRVDQSGVGTLNIGNWDRSGTKVDLNIFGDLMIRSAGGGHAPKICLGGDCISSWPTGGAGAGGDITSVIVGTGISGGGSTGDVTVSFDQAYGDGRYVNVGGDSMDGSSTSSILRVLNNSTGNAVNAYGYGGTSIYGWNSGGNGITGYSSGGFGVYGSAQNGTAIFGQAGNGLNSLAGDFYQMETGSSSRIFLGRKNGTALEIGNYDSGVFGSKLTIDRAGRLNTTDKLCIDDNCISAWEDVGAGRSVRPLLFTRAKRSAYKRIYAVTWTKPTLAELDSACTTEFGSNYRTAVQGDVAMNEVEGVEYWLFWTTDVLDGVMEISNGELRIDPYDMRAAVRPADISASVACVNKSASLIFTRAKLTATKPANSGTWTTPTLEELDSACIVEFGSNYRTAVRGDVAINEVEGLGYWSFWTTDVADGMMQIHDGALEFQAYTGWTSPAYSWSGPVACVQFK